MEDDKDLLDILLDNNNKDNIVLEDDDGNAIEFEQVAVIPYKKDGEKYIFAVLHPVTYMKGVGEEECIVFRVEDNGEGESTLFVEDDEKVYKAVYDKYISLVKK